MSANVWLFVGTVTAGLWTLAGVVYTPSPCDNGSWPVPTRAGPPA